MTTTSTFAFTAESAVLEDPCGVSLANSTGDWLGLAFDVNEEPDSDDPTARIYSEYYDQGNGGWGGISACAVAGDRFVLSLAGERDALLNIELRLGNDAHAALRERLRRIFREAPDRLQLGAQPGAV